METITKIYEIFIKLDMKIKSNKQLVHKIQYYLLNFINNLSFLLLF